jgi:hypothetical protein
VVPVGVEEGEVAFFIVSTGSLVVAEFFLDEAGGLRLLPSPAMEDSEAFGRSLRELLRMPIEQVLVAHGEPIVGGGDAAVRDALQAFSA